MRWGQIDRSLRYELLAWRAPVWEPLIAWGLEPLGDLAGKRILEIGCGDGGLSCLLALCGAEVFAADLQIERLNKARQLAAQLGVEGRVHFAVMDAYALPYAAPDFDVILTRSVLVLLDRPRALASVTRALKKGDGTAVFIENMDRHPLVALWRKATRTKWSSQYLTPEEIPLFQAHFERVAVEYSGLLLPLASITGRFENTASRITAPLDNLLLRAFPVLSRFAWIAALHCKNPLCHEALDED